MFSLRISKRSVFLILLSFAITSGAVFAARSFSFGKPTNTIQLPPTASPVALAHVPAGIPVVLSNFSIGADDDGNGKQPYLKGISFRAVGVGGTRLTSLNFTVFEFNAKGMLKRVSGFVSEQDDIGQRPADITFPLARRFQSDDKLVLVVDAVSNDTSKWEVSINDLARQAANLLKGKSAEVLAIKENKEATPDSGAILCLKNMRRANELAQPASIVEKPAQITALSCDQNQRTFSFSILGKNL